MGVGAGPVNRFCSIHHSAWECNALPFVSILILANVSAVSSELGRGRALPPVRWLFNLYCAYVLRAVRSREPAKPPSKISCSCVARKHSLV